MIARGKRKIAKGKKGVAKGKKGVAKGKTVLHKAKQGLQKATKRIANFPRAKKFAGSAQVWPQNVALYATKSHCRFDNVAFCFFFPVLLEVSFVQMISRNVVEWCLGPNFPKK